jgi:glycolate oxidase
VNDFAANISQEIFLAFLQHDQVLHKEADLLTYEADAVTLEKFRPSLVLLPNNADEVAQIVRVCNERHIPFVVRGAGTGLSGGALAITGGVMIVTQRLNRILEVNEEELYAVVEPGVVNSHLSRRVKQAGLHFAPDPSSGAAATIGGNIAENAGGPHCLKYGATAEHILALEVVLHDGSMIMLERGTATEPLLSLMIGSEGTLGIVTKAKVRLTPLPERVETMLIDFPTPRHASEAVSNIIASGILPAALEMIDAEVLDALEAAFKLGFPVDAGALLILELDGKAASLVRLVEDAKRICIEAGARDVRVARNDSERNELWKARKRAFGALGRVSPSYYTQDGVIPRKALAHVLEEIAVIGKKHGVRIANIFHAGDGNLHPAILYDERDPVQVKAVLAASADILKLCIAQMGSITGEHGVGIEKQEALGWMFAAQDIKIMQRIREVFNPHGHINGGKFLPTDHTCREVAPKYRKVGL